MRAHKYSVVRYLITTARIDTCSRSYQSVGCFHSPHFSASCLVCATRTRQAAQRAAKAVKEAEAKSAAAAKAAKAALKAARMKALEKTDAVEKGKLAPVPRTLVSPFFVRIGSN